MRKPAYANVSLAPPEPIQANFGAPTPMTITPSPIAPDEGDSMAGLGQSLMGLKKRFGKQGGQIKGALQAGTEGKA